MEYRTLWLYYWGRTRRRGYSLLCSYSSCTYFEYCEDKIVPRAYFVGVGLQNSSCCTESLLARVDWTKSSLRIRVLQKSCLVLQNIGRTLFCIQYCTSLGGRFNFCQCPNTSNRHTFSKDRPTRNFKKSIANRMICNFLMPEAGDRNLALKWRMLDLAMNS